MAPEGEIQDVGHVLLKGCFPLYPKNKPIYSVTVEPRQIKCVSNPEGPSSKILSLDFLDIIGCDSLRGKTKEDQSAYLTVYAYPHKKKFASKKTSRHRETITLKFCEHTTYEENAAMASRWLVAIRCLAKKVPITSPLDLLNIQPPPVKRILVLVNPFSGPGTAISQFQQRVVALLAEASFQYHMIVTEYAGHARDYMHQLNLTEWSGVVIMSGDGLLFEVVNGFMEREDWAVAMKMPLGVLPGGSGNALVCALLYGAKERLSDDMLLPATFMLVKHDILPMDLVAVELASGKKLFSFLSVGWGIVSDVDIESEKYRSMGGARFTLGALIRIFNLRRYRGKLSYLPVEGNELNHHVRRTRSLYDPFINGSSDPASSGPTRSHSMIGNISLQQDLPDTPTASPVDSVSDQGDCVGDSDLVNVTPSVNGILLDDEQANTNRMASADGSYNYTSSVPTPLLPPLTDPVPADWVTIEEDFVMVSAVYQTHLSKEMIAAPSCRLDDGLIHLSIIRGNITKMKMLQGFTDYQEGTIEENPNIDTIRVKAFRLEPITPNGHITVDGELVEYGPLQAQVLPSAARIMSLRPPGVECRDHVNEETMSVRL